MGTVQACKTLLNREEPASEREAVAPVGSVEFFVGPSQPAGCRLEAAAENTTSRPLIDLALVAASYGKTTLQDRCGGPVVIESKQKSGKTDFRKLAFDTFGAGAEECRQC